jgi:putative transposase
VSIGVLVGLVHSRPWRHLATLRCLSPDRRVSGSLGRSRGRRRIKHTVPERDDQITRRKAQGSRGGRPPAFDPLIYRHRNTVGRGVNRLKLWRGIATRDDKYALTHVGGVIVVAAITAHRLQLTDTT